MTSSAFSLRDVQRALGRGPVLRVEEWTVGRGEQWAVTGSSGCGKSSVLNIIAGVLPIDAGDVNVLGKDLRSCSSVERDALRGRDVGMIFQNFNLLEPFTALENVLLGLRFARKKSSNTIAEKMLGRVGLGHRLNTYPTQLSIGERQRVAVARALAPEPALLLADEPTASLDPASATDVCELIQSLCREQSATLIFVTHDQEVISKFDHRFDASSLLQEAVSA